MEAAKVSNIPSTTENKHEEWFASWIEAINEHIKSDKKSLEIGNASAQTVDFYKSLIDGDTLKTMSISRNVSSNSILKKMVIFYLDQLKTKSVNLVKLAIDISTNKLLVWAEIKENDEKTEFDLIRIESIVNAAFAELTGIHLDSIIVEDCDKLPIPYHYNSVVIN